LEAGGLMAETSIEWAQRVWNPSTGCDKVSPGCGLARPDSDDEETGQTGGCYAMAMAKRLKGMGKAKYQNDGDPRTSGPGFGITIHPDALSIPLGWTKPRRIFVNSMSDLFHGGVSNRFVAQVFAVMAAAPQHTFQLLTKRHARMRSLLNDGTFRAAVGIYLAARLGDDDADFTWPLPNVWLGVSVENQKFADIRIPYLLRTPAAVRWLSVEPLIGPLNLRYGQYAMPDGETYGTSLDGIDWCVLGGESGPGARPMHPDWARFVRDQCQSTGTPYFFKQFGAYAPVADKPKWGDVWVHPDGSTVAWDRDDGHIRHGLGDFKLGDAVLVRKVGKKAAGRELDGRLWDQFPQAAEVAR
jgi:protein gp37